MDEMNSAIPDHVSPSKVHTWMLILLSWIAIFSLISVGLLLTKGSSSSLSATDITAACQNGSINAITTNLTRISDACQTTQEGKNGGEETTTNDITIKGTEFYPGFITPAGWHVSGNMTNNDTYTILMSDKPNIVYYFGTDAPSETKITIKTEPMPASALPNTQAAYVTAQFPATGFEHVSTSSSTVATGTLYVTEADQLYEIGGNIHQTTLHYFSPTKLVTIIYDNTATEASWEAIKNSLDFSSIK